MKKISRSALLPYSSKLMFELVNDVESYCNFLPWCGESSVLESSNCSVVASIVISKVGIEKKFITRNNIFPFERIEMQLIEGPFKELLGSWSFYKLDNNSCKIEFDIAFEMKNGILNMAIGNVFEKISSTLVDSFCVRAKELYGNKS